MVERPFPRLRLAIVLALPLLALAVVWGATRRMTQQGTDWLVPIHGDDPADLLRGHFVQYRYDWPVDGTNGFDPGYADRLCLEGVAPHIARVRAASEQGSPCAVIVRATAGTRREVQGLNSGILYLSQSRMVAVSRALADPAQQAFVRVRIRPDGVMQPVDLQFARGAGTR